MAEKKKQHYVPRFYLNYFIDREMKPKQNPYLWVFEKNNQKPFRKSPKNIGFESYFYSFEPTDHYPHEIENRLAEIESEVKVLFKEIINGKLEIKDIKKRYLFSKFISFMCYRTIKAKEVFKTLAQNTVKSKLINQIQLDGGIEEYLRNHDKDWDADEFLKSFNDIKIIPPKELYLELMLQAAKQMIPLLAIRNWLFIKPSTNNRFFVTSDHPVLLYDRNIDNRYFMPGIAEKNTDIIFPISPQICFYGSFYVNEGITLASEEEVVFINNLIASTCRKYVFSNQNNFHILFLKN